MKPENDLEVVVVETAVAEKPYQAVLAEMVASGYEASAKVRQTLPCPYHHQSGVTGILVTDIVVAP